MIHLCADDLKLVREINSKSDVCVLQEDLNKLQVWSRTWQLVFNAEKCKIMHVGKTNQRRQYFILEGKENCVTNCMEKTDLEKDLGVWVDSSHKIH